MSASGKIPVSGARGEPAVDQARTIAPFLGFAALLRRAGFAVAPEQTIAWLAGIELLGPRGIDDIRRAAHATLAPPPEGIEEFDALFDAHFLGAVEQGLEAPPEEEEIPRAADDSAGGPEPIFGEDELESGAEATAAEKLAARRFAVGDDDSVLRSFARAVPARVPRRRGYRWRSARGGQAYDARRMFRDAMRHAGELVSLRWRKRRLRQRRIVVLIDVSGSMKERTQAHLTFAHALARAADAVEVFTIGTRLTRVTRALHLRNREQALAAASRVVADWDGGTRIGEALAAFLAVPRFSALARGAAIVVLSDGLERGDPAAMRDAVERLSRISWRIIWLTPLATDVRFEPRTAGLVAARPYLDEIGSGGSLEHICAHVLDLANERAA
jgi:uncharacterized protein with von Willebrand factor type A (vWA) domain